MTIKVEPNIFVKGRMTSHILVEIFRRNAFSEGIHFVGVL